MSPVLVSDEMYYLIRTLKFNEFNVRIMKLIGRKEKHATISRANDCFSNIARELKVPYFSHRHFRFSKLMSEDGLHSNASHIRELAPDF